MVTCRAHERVREANGVVDGLLSNHAEVEHAREEYTKLREQGGPNSTQGIREQEEQGEEWYSPGRDLVSLRPEQQEENLEGGRTSNKESRHFFVAFRLTFHPPRNGLRTHENGVGTKGKW